MVKKDKKSKAAEQKARVAAKQNKKAAQKEKKTKSKGGDDSDAEDVDLESVLEEYAKQVWILLLLGLSSIFQTLMISASPISEGHRDDLRATIAEIISYIDRFTL